MKDPQEALAAARRRAAADSPGEDGEGAPWSLKPSGVSTRRLAEWAIVSPDEGQVHSTRRWGQPITAAKLLLVRLLRQYIGQMSAQQSRFNAHIAAHVTRLEERVAELEAARREERGGERSEGAAGPGEPPPG